MMLGNVYSHDSKEVVLLYDLAETNEDESKSLLSNCFLSFYFVGRLSKRRRERVYKQHYKTREEHRLRKPFSMLKKNKKTIALLFFFFLCEYNLTLTTLLFVVRQLFFTDKNKRKEPSCLLLPRFLADSISSHGNIPLS